MERLTTLEQSDVSWRDFYAGRRAAFETRAPTTSKQVSDDAADGSPPEDPREAAAQALKSGGMRRLGRLADLMATVTSPTRAPAHGATARASPTSARASHHLGPS